MTTQRQPRWATAAYAAEEEAEIVPDFSDSDELPIAPPAPEGEGGGDLGAGGEAPLSEFFPLVGDDGRIRPACDGEAAEAAAQASLARPQLARLMRAFVDAALSAAPPAVRAHPAAAEAAMRELIALKGDGIALQAALCDPSFPERAGLAAAAASTPARVCAVCCFENATDDWSCAHGTCASCSAFVATTEEHVSLVTAPHIGPGSLLAAQPRIPCAATGGPAACLGFMPLSLRAAQLRPEQAARLRPALEDGLALAAAAPFWRACRSAACARFIATQPASQQSAACAACGAATCLLAGSAETSCAGAAHDGIPCETARDLAALLAANAPALRAAEEAARAAAAGGARAVPPEVRSLHSNIHRVRDLMGLLAEPLLAQRRLAAAQGPDEEPLPPPSDAAAIEARALEVLDGVASREARLRVGASAAARAADYAAKAARSRLASVRPPAAAAAAAADVVAELASVSRNMASLAQQMAGQDARPAGKPQRAAAAAAAAAAVDAAAAAATAAERARAMLADAGATVDHEAAAAQWKLAHTRPCPTPGCGVDIEKTEGSCNAMEPCRGCQRAFCWSCLGPVHEHSYGPCSRARDRAAVQAALQAAGRSAAAAAAQAAAMAAADARPRAAAGRDVAEARRLERRAESELQPGDAERVLAPLQLALQLARASGSAEAWATVHSLLRAIHADVASGVAAFRARQRAAAEAERAAAAAAPPRRFAPGSSGRGGWAGQARAGDAAAADAVLAAARSAVDCLCDADGAAETGERPRRLAALSLASAWAADERLRFSQRAQAAAAGEGAGARAVRLAASACAASAEAEKATSMAALAQHMAGPLRLRPASGGNIEGRFGARLAALAARADGLARRAAGAAELPGRVQQAHFGWAEGLAAEAAELRDCAWGLLRGAPGREPSLSAFCGGAAAVRARRIVTA